MIVMIPVVNDNASTQVAANFGRAPYFMLRDTATGAMEFVKNTAADSPGGAGIKAAQIVVDHGPGALLVPQCGQNAADVIHGAGIPMYQTRGFDLEKNMEALIRGELEVLTEIHAGFHGHGAGK